VEGRNAEVIKVGGHTRVVAVGLTWVQMREWRDRIRVSNVKIHLGRGSAQSTFPICSLEALTTDRGVLRYALGGGVFILSRNMVFAVEVWPLDFAWKS
jgi:hypothetical protein